MALTPIPLGSSIVLRETDPNDPATSISAFLSPPEFADEELGNSFGADSPQHFIGVMRVYALFHSLPFVNQTRYEP